MNKNIELIKSMLLLAKNLAEVSRITGVRYRNIHYIVYAKETPRYMKKESYDALLSWAKKQSRKKKVKNVEDKYY